MSLIEQAARRLEALVRAGVSVPWGAAGVNEATARQLARPSGQDPFRPAAERPPAANERVVRLPTAEVADAPAPLALDLDALARRGYLVPALARSREADEFRRAKRVLLSNAWHGPKSLGGRGRLMLVTSSVPGEGKTFCAINLALSMAMEVKTSVLLVDADVIRPSLLARLGAHAERGLTDLLLDPTLAPRSLVLETNVPNLSLLPSGRFQPHAHELFAGGAMNDLLLNLIAERPDRLVVIDAAALLVTTEAQALAALVGQVVMVVEAATTPRRLVQQAFAQLEHCPAVMALLNKSTVTPESDRYGDYYAPPVDPFGPR